MPYTSGTTGQPKGCMHTHRTVMHTTVASMKWFALQPEMTLLGVAPMFHVTGMQGGMNGPLYTGNTLVLLPRWDREAAAHCVERYHVASFTAIPTMIQDFFLNPNIDKYDLTSIRRLSGGGAAMPAAVAQRLASVGITYVEGYGLTETMAATHINPSDRPKQQCLGIPIFGVDSRIIDPATLRELPPGEVGEIIIHGPQVFLGYWNKSQDTAQVFMEIDGKRFFRSGDLGRVDEDGYFFMVDRLKRMINASGYKVWPTELESTLYHHPAVREACIIGTKDAHRGETVKAVIVLRDEWRGKIEAQAIVDWCREHMAAYKVPACHRIRRCTAKIGFGENHVARIARARKRFIPADHGRSVMKALLSHRTGGPDTLVLEDVPEPVPGRGEVRIRVRAVGVNFPDLLMIQDLYQIKPPRPFSPGGELSGVIEALGEGVTSLKLGERVLACPVRSAMAQKAVAAAANCWRIPDVMPFDEAAALMLTYGTSQHALKDRAQLRAGETLLVLGAAGGVGLAAVELGKAMGARVIAAASSAEKLALAREHGADDGVQYPVGALDKATAKTLSETFKTACGAQGAHVIYDGIGGDYTEAALRAIAWQGRHLVVGFTAGIPKLPLNLALLKSCQIVGVFWGEFTKRFPEVHAANVAALMQLYLDGKIKPAVTQRYPLARGGAAIAQLGARTARGKIIVTVFDEA